MKLYKLIWICSLSLFSVQVFAYGSSSSAKSCVAPRFDQFVPVEKTEVAPHSKFSFQTSPDTDIKSLKVSIKEQPVEVFIDSHGQNHTVSGIVPANFKSTYVRITISASGLNGCQASGGWLLKISP